MQILTHSIRLLALTGTLALTAPLASARLPKMLKLQSSVQPVLNALGPNMVFNEGFETGDATGYTVTPAASGSFCGLSGSAADAHSGNYSFVFGGVTPGSYDTISQTLVTVPGATYSVSFWLANIGGTPNGFLASFGNTPLLDITNSPDFAYTQYTYTATADDATTVLSFAGYHQPFLFFLDDISVNLAAEPVPEPSTWALLGVGAFGLGWVTLRRRQAAVRA